MSRAWVRSLEPRLSRAKEAQEKHQGAAEPNPALAPQPLCQEDWTGRCSRCLWPPTSPLMCPTQSPDEHGRTLVLAPGGAMRVQVPVASTPTDVAYVATGHFLGEGYAPQSHSQCRVRSCSESSVSSVNSMSSVGSVGGHAAQLCHISNTAYSQNFGGQSYCSYPGCYSSFNNGRFHTGPMSNRPGDAKGSRAGAYTPPRPALSEAEWCAVQALSTVSVSNKKCSAEENGAAAANCVDVTQRQQLRAKAKLLSADVLAAGAGCAQSR